MKPFLFSITTLLFLFLLIPEWCEAQTKQPLAPDCYASNLKKGNSYRSLRNYDLAIKHYRVAKYCRGIKKVQSNHLDSLIALTQKQQTNSKTVRDRPIKSF